MKARGRGSGGSGWVGVFLFSNKSTQRHQRFSETPVPASLILLSKSDFLSHFPFTVPELPAPKLQWVASARAWFIQMGMSKCR